MQLPPTKESISFSYSGSFKGGPNYALDISKVVHMVNHKKNITTSKIKYTFKKDKINITGNVKKNKKTYRINIKNITESEVQPSITKFFEKLGP
jgi:hypothetical protein